MKRVYKINNNILTRRGIDWINKPIIKTYKENRLCKYPECMAELSIYNDGRYCFFHATKVIQEQFKEEAEKYAKKQGKKNKKMRERFLKRTRKGK